jgi:glyoxylase-like metal-dependent hydrolase (beta-lactamase superfamily II)
MIGYLYTDVQNNVFSPELSSMLNVKIFQFNPLQEKTYLVFNEQLQCIIIDPGCYTDQERTALSQFISNKGLKPNLLVNTHCHLDHVFGNKFIHEHYGLELHIHEGEQKVLEMAPTSGLMWNLPFDNYQGKLHFIDESLPIQMGEDQLEILFTPGHSPASISFYSRKNDLLIAGDVLFRESVGRTDLPGGNPDVLAESIKTKLYTLPDETIVYPGHGIPTTIGHEKRHNPFITAA